MFPELRIAPRSHCRSHSAAPPAAFASGAVAVRLAWHRRLAVLRDRFARRSLGADLLRKPKPAAVPSARVGEFRA